MAGDIVAPGVAEIDDNVGGEIANLHEVVECCFFERDGTWGLQSDRVGRPGT